MKNIFDHFILKKTPFLNKIVFITFIENILFYNKKIKTHKKYLEIDFSLTTTINYSINIIQNKHNMNKLTKIQ